MIKQQLHWENRYSGSSFEVPAYDGWLDKYMHILADSDRIVDLGCGNGVDTIYLASKGIYTIACDFSESALDAVKKHVPEIETHCFDMSLGLPFSDASIDTIISDLSLHYFSLEVTHKIIQGMRRILKPSGRVLCRLNSIAELSAETPPEKEIEKNYYLINGCTKRYFDLETIEKCFDGWQITHVYERTTDKYGSNKNLWEICLLKNMC